MPLPFAGSSIEHFKGAPSVAAQVLDVGCGFGPNAIFLGSKGVEVTGIDLSPEAIAEAEERLAAAGVLRATCFVKALWRMVLHESP